MKQLVESNWKDKGCVLDVAPHKSGYRFKFERGEDVIVYGSLIIIIYEIGLLDVCISNYAFMSIKDLI